MKSLQKNKLSNIPDKVVLTGYRMLKILKLLISKPHSAEEINLEFNIDKNIKKTISNDMICLYINTLRHIGCKISRPSKTNGYKYVLSSHPFDYTISKKESATLTIILENLMHKNDWEFLIDICDAFKEIKGLASEESDLNFLRIISGISKINSDFIKKLNSHCQKKRKLILEYSSTNSKIKDINIIADKIFLENSKLYLWGYNQELEEMQYLRIDRIKNIKLVSLKNSDIKQKNLITVKYKLLNNKEFEPKPNQKIIEKTSTHLIVEELIENKFKFIQKTLNYADDCIILAPESIKNEIITTLKELLETYE